ncbi:MAG: penicillin-binding transpeptidase domain-containing protein [bacterium]|nr:penicillin-binding transpeptidase domain-containing protein [bacterium]
MFLKRNKNYSIAFDGDDWVTPEETLLDSKSQYSDIEKPIPESIFRLFFWLFSSIIIVLACFIFKIAIFDHGMFAQIAFQNKSANFPLPPPRGLILDRNSQILARNIPVFNLLAVTRELKENNMTTDEYIKKIAKILGQDEEVFLQSVRERMDTNSTFLAYSDLTKDQAVAIKYLETNGLYVVPDTKREYIDGNKTAQIIGYTGKVNKEDLADSYYFSTDIIGRLGVESYYEQYLRGQHGNIFFSREEEGYITKEPEPGKSLVLNIDHDLQIKLHDEIFAVLRDSGLSRGVGIIQNPKTGAVLALVSFPDFDNNIFTSRLSENEYKNLFNNKAKPLLNRVASGLYNPGSTIKPLIGMAALEEKVVDPDDTINDCIKLTVPNQYNPEDSYIFDNWRVEYGPFNLKRAIANSCNIYFFTVGGGHDKIKGLGAEKIARYLKDSFADSLLNIDLPGENNGFVPTPDWKLREKGEQWYLGDTYNTSIGQGDLLITPLWLNSYISAIANEGSIYRPRVARAIVDNNQEVVENFEPETIGSLPFTPETIQIMKAAMRETVLSGTAQILKELPVQMAAKTGTAEVQKGRTANSLFTVFGPYEDPDLAMTILIEGVSTQQGLAVRAAYNVLKWYYGRN